MRRRNPPGRTIDPNVLAFAREVGCTYDECGGRNVWLAIVGEEGSAEEGQYAFLCEAHVKEMLSTNEDVAAWSSRLSYVEAVGRVSLS